MIVSYSQSVGNNCGRNNFMRNLFARMSELYGTQFQMHRKGDIHLAFPGEPCRKGSKNIVRIDGVYYDKQRLSWNNSIKRTINLANGVIYQSNWSQIFAERMLQVRNPTCAVIPNGAIVWRGSKDKRGFEKVFIASAHWRPSKRLDAILAAFRKIATPEIGLFVVGECQPVPQPSVVYLGNIQHEQVVAACASADYCIHICHLDACPNSVVEALVSGIPVLCNNIGGTPEIVGTSGYVVNIDKPFDFKPIPNMESVGAKIVDIDVLAEGMRHMLRTEWQVDRPDLSLDVAAQRYHEFFLKVVNA